MTYEPPEEWVEKVTIALHDADCPERGCEPQTMGAYRKKARAVLVAVGPSIAAQGIREYVAAARENRSAYEWEPSEVFNDAEEWADSIEQEAR